MIYDSWQKKWHYAIFHCPLWYITSGSNIMYIVIESQWSGRETVSIDPKMSCQILGGETSTDGSAKDLQTWSGLKRATKSMIIMSLILTTSDNLIIEKGIINNPCINHYTVLFIYFFIFNYSKFICNICGSRHLYINPLTPFLLQ